MQAFVNGGEVPRVTFGTNTSSWRRLIFGNDLFQDSLSESV